MLSLSLSPAKGNAGGRYFPYQGYLGLTPLRVDGVVRTKLDEDNKPIPAKSLSVSVRCYESRQGKTGTLHTRVLVDYTTVLWRKQDSHEYDNLGNFDSTFKITLPKHVAGFSTANYQEYRTFWRVEAVLEHAHLTGVGSRILRYFDLPLIRYDVPPPLPSPLPATPNTQASSSTPHALHLPSNRSSTPILYYNLSTPTLPIGPSDLVFTSLFLRPLDPSVSIRSASVIIERRIDLHHISPNSSHAYTSTREVPSHDESHPPPLPSNPLRHSPGPPQITTSSSMPESSRTPHIVSPSLSTSTYDSIPTASSSTFTINSTTPLLSPPSPRQAKSYPVPPSTPSSDTPSRTITTTITYADSGIGGFAFDRSTGVWSKTVSLQWPKSKSKNVWAIGESVKTELAEVSFWVKAKIIVSSPTTGTDTLDLEPRELTVVSTNDSDRRIAIAKFAEQRELSARSKSKSPGRNVHSSSGHKRMAEGDLEAEEEFAAIGAAGIGRGASALATTGGLRRDEEKRAGSHPSAYHSSHYTHSRPNPQTNSAPSHSASSRSSESTAASSHSYNTSVVSSATSNTTATTSSTGKKSSRPPTSKFRRPHTSAGPRDTSNLPYVGVAGSPVGSPRGSVESGGKGIIRMQPSLEDRERAFNGTAHNSPSSSFPKIFGLSASKQPIITSQYSPTSNNYSPTSHTYSPTGNNYSPTSPTSGNKEDLVRAWEEELTRIENVSRRSSADMLNFFGGGWGRKKKRSVAAG